MRCLFLGALVATVGWGCSEESSSSDNGDGGASGSSGGTGVSGSPGTGGAVNGTGGAQTGGASGAATGGAGGTAGASTGGASSTGGGAGTGGTGTGGTASTSICPPGSENDEPDLSGTPEPVDGVPPSGYGGFNLEGPVWSDGALYLSEIQGGAGPPPARIVRYVPGGGATEFVAASGTNGLALDPSGRLIGASHGVGGIVRFDWQNPNATPERIVFEYEGTRFSSPNDLTMNDDGILYFTDPSYQAGSERQDEERAYWVDSSNTVRVIEGAPRPPNGISLSPDQRTLYIGGGDPLRAFPIESSGAPGTGENFGDEEYRGVDGMGVDCAGNLYVTLHGEGRVVVLSPSGAFLGDFSVGSGVTNVAFGGADRTTLFITKLNPPALFEVDVGIAGYPY